jgi:hypothetical protein
MTWKQFISIEHFKELKSLFIIEFIILALLILLCQTPEYQKFITLNQLTIFNPFALLATIFAYCLSTCIDPEKYFNLATLISVGSFTYGCFWFMFELMIKI